jgi:hypothetical protein
MRAAGTGNVWTNSVIHPPNKCFTFLGVTCLRTRFLTQQFVLPMSVAAPIYTDATGKYSIRQVFPQDICLDVDRKVIW